MPYAPTDADQSDCGDLCIGVGAYGHTPMRMRGDRSAADGSSDRVGGVPRPWYIEIERLRQAVLKPAFEGRLG